MSGPDEKTDREPRGAPREGAAAPPGVRNIILTGFMGVGKSTIARHLARRLGWRLLDTDAAIERRAGKSIARIFAEDGEPAFRAIETEVARSLADLDRHVVATGGGMALADANRRALERAGALVLLEATPQTIWRRVSRTSHRPLLRKPNPRAEIDRLLAERAPAYGRIRLKVSTDRGSPEAHAGDVLRCIAQDRRSLVRLRVELAERSYPIEIGHGWIERLGETLDPFYPPRRCLLVTHPMIGALWDVPVIAALERAGYAVERFDIPDGEAHKTLATVSSILDALVQGKYDRQCGVIALGGGVVGDIAGFAAASFLRGVPYIQLPTSLLAMVDSSVGGKTGVNHPRGKNLIGAFWQPTLVGVELDFLATLPPEELCAGMAEVIKYGAIADADFLDYLDQNMNAALARDPAVLTHLVTRCCQIKAEVVSGDEREESGRRAILNFGHTFGHAAEALSHYGAIRHGEGVAMGMVAATRLAAARSLVPADYAARLERLIARAGLPTRMLPFSPDEYWGAMASDKKVRDGRIRFILPTAPGRVALFDDVTREEAIGCLIE